MIAKTIAFVIGSILCGGTALWALTTPDLHPPHASPAASYRLVQNWQDLSPQERARALDNYRRFQKLSPEKRQNLEQQYNRWMELPNEEKDRLRRNYDRYRKMDSDQKEEFSRKYKQWRSSPR